MCQPPDDVSLRTAVAEIAREPSVQGILVVGSYVGGTMAEGSDVDLVVLHNRREGGSRRYLCHRRHGVLLDIKYWTPEVAEAMLCGPYSAPVIMCTGGVQVLLDRDGAATAIAARIRLAASQAAPSGTPAGPISPTERLHLDTSRRSLCTVARHAIAAEDWPQAWFTIQWSVGKLIEAIYRLARVPYADLGKGLRHFRADFPLLAARVDLALQSSDPEVCRRVLLTIAEDVLGELAFSDDQFDTGWFDEG